MDLPRDAFPALEGNTYTYLNSGSSGPESHATIRAMREANEVLTGPAYLEGLGLFAHQREAYGRAREAAASLMSVSPEDVALTQSTTHGMNLGTFALDWREGDEAISCRSEHPGCLVPLHAVARRFGVNVKLVEPPVTPEKIEAAMTSRTRLVALSHVDWTNGDVLPLAEITSLSRDQGVLTLVDGAQSTGNIPVDVPETGADMYAVTGHKWVLGPEGMGALYVRPGLAVGSTNVGFLSLPDPTAFRPDGDYELKEGAGRFESSTMNPTLAAGFAEAARAVHERGEAGFAGIRRRADLLMDMLDELPRVTLCSPRPARSGLVSFEVEGVPSKEAAERLLREKFVLRYIPEPYPYLRASTHLFNSSEELEALAAAVGSLRSP